MIKFKEIELKYNASGISLTDFISFCEARSPTRGCYVCGYDHFYSDTRNGTDDLVRHRVGQDFNQLTFKRKTSEKNNFIRTENNISLQKEVTKAQAAGLCQSFGFEFNTSIFKNIYVYEYPRYVLSYYVVYDLELKELARFVEIEMSEEHPWESEEEAWGELVKLETEAKVLGITAKGRIKKSLFEQFRR